MLKEKLLMYSFILNFVFLTLHEMDAVFWKEWRIFGLSNDVFGMKIFIIAHVPLFIVILLSMIKLETIFGKVVSLIFSSFLILHFFLHYNALVQNYFNEMFSFGIIICILTFSIIQLICTILSFRKT